MNSKPSHKDITNLSAVLRAVANDLNLARLRCFQGIILALIQSRSVNYEKVACCFDDGRDVKISSRVRQIQRFVFADLITELHICYIFKSLNMLSGKLDLVLDRTNWERLGAPFNIMAIGVRYKGCAIPLIFSLLPKKGTSNTQERIDLMDRIIKIVGLEQINSLTADREFIGAEWINYLTSKKINYHMRIKATNRVTLQDGKSYSMKTLFKGLQLRQYAVNHKKVVVFGQLCYLSAVRVPAQGGKTELLAIISFSLETSPFEQYKERWQVETMFKAFKSSGLNIENPTY